MTSESFKFPALPDDYNAYEHLLGTYRQEANQLVWQQFRDVADGDYSSIPALNGRQNHYLACLHHPEDTEGMTKMRTDLFFMVGGQAKELQAPIYGQPVNIYRLENNKKPQIELYFDEDLKDVETGYPRLTGSVTFRLMHESEETITKAELQELARKIKSIMGTSPPAHWKKGRELCSYTDRDHGVKFQIQCFSLSEAKQIITKALEIQNLSPDWKKSNHSENLEAAEKYPTIPRKKTVLGRQVQESRHRGVGTVHFRWAALKLPSIGPITLVDLGHRFRSSIIR